MSVLSFSQVILLQLPACYFSFISFFSGRIKFRPGYWSLQFFARINSWLAFTICHKLFPICTVIIPLFSGLWSIRLNLSRYCNVALILYSFCCHIINNVKCPYHNVVCFGSWTVPSFFQTLLLPFFCYRLTMISRVHRMWISELFMSHYCQISSLGDFFKIVPIIHLEPWMTWLVWTDMHLFWWSLLFIVDFDAAIPTSSRAFLLLCQYQVSIDDLVTPKVYFSYVFVLIFQPCWRLALLAVTALWIFILMVNKRFLMPNLKITLDLLFTGLWTI